MADILVQHNEADSDAQLANNLPTQVIGYTLESQALGYMRHDATLGDVVEFVPTLTGNGSNGVRVSQANHGFIVGTLICYNSSTRAWVKADPNAGLWATHFTSRVHTGGIFDAASAGTFRAPVSVSGVYGTLYLSATGTMTPVPTVGSTQVVAFSDGTHVFLTIENKLNKASEQKAANIALAEPVVGDDISIIYAKSQGFITDISGFLHGPGTGSVTVAIYKSTARNAGSNGTPILSAPFAVSSKSSAQDLLADYPINVAPGEFIYGLVTDLTGNPTYLNLVVTFTGVD